MFNATLYPFQTKHEENLLAKCADHEEIVLYAPTGSGKTVMVCKFIDDYLDENPDTVFLWLCPGAGGLAKQSQDSFEEVTSGINYQTGQPTLQIGFYGWQRVKKKGKLPSHANPHWVELGTSPIGGKRKARKPIQPKNAKVLAYNDVIYGRSVQHPGTAGTHILRNTVQNNIAEIRAAQAEYLAELSKKIEEAKGKCYTGEDTDEDD